MTHTPAHLIAEVPFALGFHPTDSLVATAVDGPALVFAARVDLLDPGHADDCRFQAGYLARIMARQRPAGVTLIGYGRPDRVTPAVLRTSEAMQRRGLPVLDELRVTDGRWWSYRCTDPLCCPPDGSPCLPPDSVVAVAATVAGAVALPDRMALVAQVAAVTGTERAAMTAATLRARHDLAGDPVTRRAGRAAVREAEKRYRTGGRLTDDELARLTVLLADEQTQEYAWSRIGEDEWRVTMWTDLVRRADPDLVPWPAALLTYVAWRLGRGALAQVAVDRALEREPGHQVAGLLLEILQNGVPATALADPPPERVHR